MKNILYLISLVLIILIPACQSAPGKVTIGYVQITQDPSLDVAKASLFQALADSGFAIGEQIKVIDHNAQGDLSMISTILQSFQSQGVDMVITNSTPCMVAASHAIRDIPVVFTVSFSPDQVGSGPAPPNLYGVYDTIQGEMIANIMQECIPGLSRVGIPYNNAEPNATLGSRILKDEFTRRGIQVITASVTSVNDLAQAVQYLVDQNVEAFALAADNTVYLGLPVISKVATDRDIPIFVTDPPQVNNGAAIGYGIAYDSWGYQSGLKAVEILKGRERQMIPIEPGKKFQLIINLANCADQGLVVPPAILDQASRIIQ
ncbi:MAG: ABC transporter substrate-binding protein [Bacteroidales bacterium]|jgi:putative ABC transport system substrate-binding protein|nr:ABC transporter substrate-binding protein [Bacteroidales bacterium]MDD2570403.1 ABC transporter substrate-binding protein [Bacteroidales bacterium]MDD2814022.1 ABC transporter substrate-binding protein [Bacteroidales bacterium]MDD3385575.1 ABC transporter substrate-binding protein [Bacteroidales bacterium]MDD3811582.1 ABC transporter substrate-binding protein [Bacteroidales bacterium]